MSLISIRNLYKHYRSPLSNQETAALSDLSLELEAHSFTALMGPSGAGKSTLLNCMGTIDKPDRGEIIIAGRKVNDLKGRDLVEFRRTTLGFVFQERSLLDTLSLGENIMLPLTLIKGLSAEDRRDRVRKISHDLGIDSLLDRYPAEVSGGQEQRAALARALVTDPALILADEPTGSLDSKNAKDLLGLLAGLKKKYGSTILMVTHDPLVASYSQRLIFIKDGRRYSELTRTEDGDQAEGPAESRRKDFYGRILAMLGVLEQGGTA